jgi:hypothetical protein
LIFIIFYFLASFSAPFFSFSLIMTGRLCKKTPNCLSQQGWNFFVLFVFVLHRHLPLKCSSSWNHFIILTLFWNPSPTNFVHISFLFEFFFLRANSLRPIAGTVDFQEFLALWHKDVSRGALQELARDKRVSVLPKTSTVSVAIEDPARTSSRSIVP